MNGAWLAIHLPEAERLVDSAMTDGVATHEFIEQRLTSSATRGGRPRSLSVRTLFVACQLGAFAGQYFLSGLADLLEPLSPATRARLGLARRGDPVSYRQICYLVTRIDEVLRDETSREDGSTVSNFQDFDRVFSAIAITGTHPDVEGSSSVAVDGSDIPTWGTYSTRVEPMWEVGEDGGVNIQHDEIGDVMYERVRVITDPDAGWRGARDVNGKEPHFGYTLSVAVSVKDEDGDPVPRAVVAARLRPTSVQDKEMGLAVVGEVAARRGRLGDVLVDRGYTSSKNGEDFLLPVRALGGEPVFGLTEYQVGPEGTIRGAVIIDGRPYSPSIPQSLRTIVPPKGGEAGTYKPNPVKLREYQEAIAAREIYALVAHGARRANHAQVFQCPGAGGKLECPLQAARKGLRPGALPVLNAPRHPAADSVCANAYPTFSLEELPLLQRHVYGSKKWFDSYARRSTSVEPFFGGLKDEAGAGVLRGRIRVMGIIKTGLFVAFAVASTNRRLALAFDKARLVVAQPQRRRTGRPVRHRVLTYRRVVEDATTAPVLRN